MEQTRQQTGLRLGLISLGLVSVLFLGVFLFGPKSTAPESQNAPTAQPVSLLSVLDEPATRTAVEALRAVSPTTFAELETAAAFAHADGAPPEDLARLTLEALFSQFQDQAFAMRASNSTSYQAIITGLADGLSQLKATKSDWCEGPAIAAFLTQNEDELVPALLSEFSYGSPQYDWAMVWMTTVLSAAKQGQDRPRRYQRPGARDEAILQEEGLALGSEQWALALQIAAFANSEGTSYGQMQEVIASMDVCDLGIAVNMVSERLPSEVRARIWADLLPEIMLGNTPYVMWRVTDYFFIG